MLGKESEPGFLLESRTDKREDISFSVVKKLDREELGTRVGSGSWD